MYSASLIIDTDVLSAIRETARSAPGKMPNYVKTVVQPRLDAEVKKRLGRDPGPVVYPFKFATAKSRRWYFAMMRGKLPYKRTGETQRAWAVKIDLRQADGLIRVFNKKPHAVYVYGPGFLVTNRQQVPGHKNTGWGKDFDDDVIVLSQLAQDLLIDGWFDIVTGKR